MEYRGVGLRFVALLVDLVVLLPLMIVMALLWGDHSATTADGQASASVNLDGFPALVFFLLVVGYYIVCERHWGATLGKRVMGLKVVDASGSRISWGQSTGRNLLRVVDILPFFYLIGAISVWMSGTKQRIGDRAATTFVVGR